MAGSVSCVVTIVRDPDLRLTNSRALIALVLLHAKSSEEILVSGLKLPQPPALNKHQ